MKITPKQYARVLQTLQSAYPNDESIVAEKFVFLLRRNHDTGLFSKIKRAFQDLYEEKFSVDVFRVQIAQKFSSQDFQDVEEKIRFVQKSPDASVVWSENPNLLGGVFVRRGEKGYDESIARRLRSLREYLDISS